MALRPLKSLLSVNVSWPKRMSLLPILMLVFAILVILAIAHFYLEPRVVNKVKEPFVNVKAPLLIYTIVSDAQNPNFLKLEQSVKDAIRESVLLPQEADLFRPIICNETMSVKEGFGPKISMLYEQLQDLKDKSTLILFVDGYDVAVGAPMDEIVA